jgi:DNA-binding GntR family transcriptional regulator
MLYINGADPLYLQLYNQLRLEIETGKLGRGQRLLSERRLAAEYGISRMTARMALKYLADKGYVYIEPNKGALVL